MVSSAGPVTRLLGRLRGGDQDALAELVPIIYKDLRRLAGQYLRQERIGHTLQPTALVHEVYLRLLKQRRADWQNRTQFIAVAAQLMRRILVDYARQRRALKRGPTITLDLEKVRQSASVGGLEEVLAVDEALARLAQLSLQQSRVVEMRYFGGLTLEEIAQVLGVSARTVNRDWAVAKAFLRSDLTGARTP
jgi:RNA polymerase sigma factor (TIGR02999 family)